MYPYILCFCGRSLGDLYDVFKAMRLEKIADAYDLEDATDIDPYLIAISDKFDITLESVFAALNIQTECCRVRMMSQVELKELY